MLNKKISASILAADFARLGEEVKAVLHAGADLIHLDIMDNHYVPNLTFGPAVCRALRQYGINVPFDVHLMAQPVDALLQSFAQAGANTLTFHPEASAHVDRSLQLIRDQGCRAGLALNPATPLACLEHVLDKIDFILIMAVNPGFGGQSFIPHALEKIARTRALIQRSGQAIELAVDGGVKVSNIQQIAAAGADTFIVGSALFGTPDYTETLQQLRAELAPFKI